MTTGPSGLVDWNVSTTNHSLVQIRYWCKNLCRNCHGPGCVADLFFYDNELRIAHFAFPIIFPYMILPTVLIL